MCVCVCKLIDRFMINVNHISKIVKAGRYNVIGQLEVNFVCYWIAQSIWSQKLPIWGGAIGHSPGISCDQGTMSTVFVQKPMCDRSVTYWFVILRYAWQKTIQNWKKKKRHTKFPSICRLFQHLKVWPVFSLNANFCKSDFTQSCNVNVLF